jgi:tetratricopeptide (TPR) repeat protein
MATNAITPAPAEDKPRRSRLALLVLAIVLLTALTYALAWYRAYSLSARFLDDAEAYYAVGDYLQALTGLEEFDQERNRYVLRGGYALVERIWNEPYAWPVPEHFERARARIDEIIDERLTLAEAERYVQVNIGRGGAYLGRIYLRTGELYEEEGDLRSAEEVYEDVLELFSRDVELVERASAHLERLQQENP